MRGAGRNNNETACWVALKLSWVEPLPFTYIPSTFDDSNEFVLRMRVGQDAHVGGYLDAFDPWTASTGIAEQLCPLPPILIVRRCEPPHLFGGNAVDLFLALRGPGHCQHLRPKNCHHDDR